MCVTLCGNGSANSNHSPRMTPASAAPEKPTAFRRWGDANRAPSWRCASRSWGQQGGCSAQHARPCHAHCPNPAYSSGGSRHARCSGRCCPGRLRSAWSSAHGIRRAWLRRGWCGQRLVGCAGVPQTSALRALQRAPGWRRSRWSSPCPEPDSAGVPTHRSTTTHHDAWGHLNGTSVLQAFNEKKPHKARTLRGFGVGGLRAQTLRPDSGAITCPCRPCHPCRPCQACRRRLGHRLSGLRRPCTR